MAGAIGGAGWGTRLQGSGLLGVRRPERPGREPPGRTFPACAATARPGPAQDVPASCLLSPGSEPSSHTNRRAFKGSHLTPALGGPDRLAEAWEKAAGWGRGEGHLERSTERRPAPGTEGSGCFQPFPSGFFSDLSLLVRSLHSGGPGLPHPDLPSRNFLSQQIALAPVPLGQAPAG